MNTKHIPHPWHAIPVGNDAPQVINTIIEISQGSKAKYELDKESGMLRLDRILTSNLRYPFHYGFIPQTLWPDGDPLDILILCSESLVPLSIIEARVLGVLTMFDGGQSDDKIIAVAQHDPAMKNIKDLHDINPETLTIIEFFFKNYKKPEGKIVKIEAFSPAQDAYTIIKKGIDLYKASFLTK